MHNSRALVSSAACGLPGTWWQIKSLPC